MFIVVARTRVNPKKTELYESTFKALREQVKAHEPFVLFYELCRDPKVPNGYVLIEAYSDQESQNIHLGTDYYLAAAPLILGCLEGVDLEEIARSGKTDPADIYPLIKSLVMDMYQPI